MSGCPRAWSLAASVAVALAAGPALAHSESAAFLQPERRDEAGRITVEAAAVHVIQCDEPGENGGEYYIYQYLYRDGFRAIDPPEWGDAIGDRDFDSYAEAAEAACGARIDPPEVEPAVQRDV